MQESDLPEGFVVPEGFELSRSRGPYTTRNGPVYRAIDQNDMRSGICILERHCNSMGFLHGGMASSFADGALAWAAWHATRKASVTLKLTMSFFATVRPGDWLEARPSVSSAENGIVHVSADMMVDERLAARADAVFRTVRRGLK